MAGFLTNEMTASSIHQPIRSQEKEPIRSQEKEPIRKQDAKRNNQSTPSTFFLSEKISSYRPKLYLL
jgi:hypothetical protein